MPPANTVFGTECPSMNLSFPDGNMTAAEIIAYFPNWLRSLDVIDRLVTNRASYSTLKATLVEHRRAPENYVITDESVRNIMRNSMRDADHIEWSLQNHEVVFGGERVWTQGSLDVRNFRPPRLTHPSITSSSSNAEPPPINFRDLARNIKKHPSGDDALDLTRCVQWALTHHKQDWFFPTDYRALVSELGGPKEITESHSDQSAFSRRAITSEGQPRPTNRGRLVAAQPRDRVKEKIQKISQSIPVRFRSDPPQSDAMKKKGIGSESVSSTVPQSTRNLAGSNTLSSDAMEKGTRKRPSSKLVAESDTDDEPDIARRLAKRRNRRLRNRQDTNVAQPSTGTTSLKDDKHKDKTWTLEEDGDASPLTSLASSAIDDLEESVVGSPTPRSGIRARTPRPTRRAAKDAFRKVQQINAANTFTPPPQRRLPQEPLGQTPLGEGSLDQSPLVRNLHDQATYGQDFFSQVPFSNDPYNQAAYGQVSHDEAAYGQASFYPQVPIDQAAYGQASHGQAPSGPARLRQVMFAQNLLPQPSYGHTPMNQAVISLAALSQPRSSRNFPADPEIEQAARDFDNDNRVAPRLDPPYLSTGRITIDAFNVAFFAEEGATDHWLSALSSTRFNGPRRHPPWRELHRLTYPDAMDDSDWAENIRWAKEQFKLYGTVWTEYDDHLEQITLHRMTTRWVSEEVLSFGRLSG